MPPLFTSEELSEAARRAEAMDVEAPRVVAGRTSLTPDMDLDGLLRAGRLTHLVAAVIDVAAIASAIVLSSFWPLAAILLTHVAAFVVSEGVANRVRRGRRRAQAPS